MFRPPSTNHPPILYNNSSNALSFLNSTQCRRYLLMLLCLAALATPTNAFRKPRGRLLGQSLLPFGYSFEFTAPEYNVSLKENTRNRPFAQTQPGEKIGIFLPPIFNKIRYKIVEGDPDKLFVADFVVLGDFAFLQIRPEKGQILNRERKSNYELIVKATLKRKNANTLETTTKVNLRILDENDNSPMFRKVEYAATVDTDTPLNSRIVRLEAFDADEGLNAEIYYSSTSPSTSPSASMFYVDSRSGWVRSFAPLSPGVYTVECFVEDRTSRLLFYSASDTPRMSIRNRANATITVTPAPIVELIAKVMPIPVEPHSKATQKAGILVVENVEQGTIAADVVSPKGLAWLEPSDSGFDVFIGRTSDTVVEVKIAVKEVHLGNRSTEVSFKVDLNATRMFEVEEIPEIFVNESVPIGFVMHQINVNGVFEAEKKLLRYRIHSDDKDLPFHLDRNTGQLRTRHLLDFEKTRSYEFTVHVKLDSVENAKASTSVRVTVLDSNDNCPHFTQLPKDHRVVLMTTTVKDTVFTVKATDADSGDNGRIMYKFASDSGPFAIDRDSGAVILAKPFPKGQKQFKLIIVATDYGVPAALWAEATVIVFASAVEAKKSTHMAVVTDACSLKNENTPKFAPFPDGLAIPEDAAVGTTITQLTASDADYGVNGLIQFICNDPYFAVDVDSGVVTIRQPLFGLFDQLNKGSEFIDYAIDVTAIDKAGYVNLKTKSLAVKGVLTVRITDVNNFAPEFEQPAYFATISESASAGIELLRVKAIDRDPGTHGRVEYVLAIDSDLISIDPDTGAVRLERPFDRELSPKTGQFQFLLGAFDRGDPSQFTFAILTVTVTDVNDNAPVCGREVQEFKLLEDAPSGQLIGCLVASDADDGLNAVLSFALEKTIPKVPFRVDSTTGCIFLDAVNPLSYDRHSRYSFNVTVADNGEPPLSTTCQVKLDLIKVNRNLMAPEFEQVALEAFVKENSPIGTLVITVTARDPEEKAVTYALVGGSGLGYFDIDPTSGAISTAAILDYEATPSYWLTVRATDAEDEPLSAYLSVLVRVQDQNDRAPLFEKPIYFTQVAENSPDDTLILRLEAEDADGRDDDIDLRYSITRGNTQSLFHIDPNMGYLVTGQRKLDREAQRQHELTVKVCDRASGRTPLCAEAVVVVDVLDKNDNKPLFNTTSNLHVHVPANRVGFLTRIFANDADADGPNSDIEYSFIGPLFDDKLRIDSYGRISTVEALKPGSQIHVTVLAQDHGEPRLNNSVTLILEALGRSRKTSAANKPPKFVEKDAWKELYVSDSDPVGVIVGIVRAEDADNDPLWYSIADDSDNPNETFAFKTATGELILARSVSLIDPALSEVTLKVVVSDGVAEVVDKLTIKISRSATSPRPRFDVETDSITLPSSALAGTVLYTAKATFTEAKTGVSHPHHLVYAIHHVDDVAVRELLRMDPHTGELVLEKPLSSAVAQNFTVILSAKVGSSENFLQLRVSRDAANIHTPRFISQHALLPITDPSIDAIVGRVQAFDADKGDKLSYCIIGGNELGFFAINESTGELKLLRELPQGFQEAVLNIRVSDSGSPAKSATTVTRLALKQTPSTRKPVILSDSIQGVNIDDETAVGANIGAAVVVADAGSLANALAFDGTCEFLEIHFASGIMRLRKALPKKNADWNLNCTLFAVNEGGNNATALVNVKIASTLAHSTNFPNLIEPGFVKENALPGTSVYTDATEKTPLVLATTSGRASKLRILSSRESYFIVDSLTGAVRVAQGIDFEKHSDWHFFVTSPSLGAFPHHVAPPTMVKLTVMNINNAAPVLVDQKEPLIVHLPPVQGARIGQIKATDADGAANVVTFGLRKSEMGALGNALEVDRVTGDIFVATNRSEDFKDNTFSIPVIASDGQHSTNGFVKLTVVDAATKDVPKDGKLHFEKADYRLQVTENSTSGPTSILFLELVNTHKAEVFHFELLNPNSAFSLSPSLGVLTLVDGKSIDREAAAQIDLLIRVQSLNDPTRTATTVVHIEIEDINDCAPEFLGEPYTVALSEDAAPGDRLLSVKARDRDIGANSQVRFSLSADAPSFLEVNKFDGRIALKSKHNLPTGEKFEFKVIATDNGKPELETASTVYATIVNKFQPIFSHSRYTATVSESAAPGTTVTSVRATAKTNGVVGYRISSGDPMNQFSIDFNSGTLKVNLPLDREIANCYNLTIEAMDVTRVGAVGTATIDIAVTDVNDSPPTFEKLLYSFEVAETTPLGSLIGNVKATDSDGSGLSYAIVEGNKTVLSLDPSTGDLHLNAELDFEAVNFYEMTLVVRDSDRLSSEAILQLKVTDANDVAPKFLHNSPLVVKLDTNQLEADDFITKIDAVDADTVASLPEGQKFRFAIVDGDETLFSIMPSTGVLRAAAKFVPDQPDVVKKLNVSVSDGIHVEHLEVHVKIHSTGAVASAPLHFEQPVYTITVAENRAPTNASAITILEAKGGSKPLTYAIYGQASKLPINVDGATGKVFLAKSMKKDETVEVPVIVEDALGRRAFTRVRIVIRDENDETPVFVAPKKGYTFAVSTASQPGEAVAAVLALDGDETDSIEYSLVSTNAKVDATKYFEVDTQTGYIVVKNELFELKPLPVNVGFAVRASDFGNPPHSSTVDVSVKVVGLPHVPPQPSRLHYVFAISEDAAVGKMIGQIQAVAVDGPSRPALDFTLPDQSSDFPFALDEKTGNLAVKSILDAETKSKYDFIVQLKDLSTTLQTYALVTVSVVDVNDNAPVFTTTVDSVNVREDTLPGTVIATFIATDADDGANGHVNYALVNCTAFSIDREFGWLSVAKPLDRETTASYKVEIIATDDGGKNTSTTVTVNVEDVNDSPPVFGKDVYAANVDRNAKIGSHIVKFDVKDSDATGKPVLFIVSGDEGGYFELHKNVLKLARSFMLAPTAPVYFNLTILAFDGTHSTETVAKITVPALLNDASPTSTITTCPTEATNLTIAGNLAPGHVIAQLMTAGTDEAVINHIIDGNRLPFEIHNQSSLVVKAGYASGKRHYRLKIKSRREQKQPVIVEPSCVHEIHVTVQNANRMAPKFDPKEYTVKVKEDVNVSADFRHFLIKLDAVDEDAGAFGQVKYSILNATGPEGMFVIDANTGALLLTKEVDYESETEYFVFVKATDGGGLSDEAKTTIQIEDVNDNAPVFEKPVYRLKVLEDEAIGYELIRVNANDSDPDAKVRYSLPDQPDAAFIKLDPSTGVITLAKALDYEVAKSLKIKVIATDDGKPPLSTECTVEIEILDVNDNAPRFKNTLYEATLAENVPAGTKVLQVSAIDADSEHFGKVSYSLSGEDSDSFDIDEEGNLLTAKAIDYEAKSLLRVNVKAVDGGAPPLSDDTLVSVTIEDVNDHAPVFGQCPMSAVVQEDVTPGHVLLSASLTDADSAVNGPPFTVKLTGDGASAFAFDADLRLIVTTKLSHASKPLYELKAIASDSKGLSSECAVTIHVQRQSTHPPEIEPLVVTVNTLHGEFLGGIVGKVKAVDKDAGDMLRFALVEMPGSTSAFHASKFVIDPENGELTVQPDILPGLHRLNVSVTDGKFTVYTKVDVDVSNIDQDALDHAVSLRLKSVSAAKFVKHYSRRFHEILAHQLGVPVTDIRFLSIQEAENDGTASVPAEKKQESPKPVPTARPHRKFFTNLTGTPAPKHAIRHRRASEPDLDILFTVSRGENHGYHRPPWVRQNIQKQIGALATESGLEIVSLTSEVCRRDVCVKGECRDRLWLDNAAQRTVYDVEGSSFVSPKHVRTFECICKQGYSGRHCDVPVNMCSKDLCTKHEMCIPSEDEPSGFRCVCPPGFRGSQCSESTCDDPSSCSQKEELSLMGNGYVQLFVANSMETRLELSFSFKTVSSNAILMFGEGLMDFQKVEITNGSIAYTWNCGTGTQSAQIVSPRVDDGHWHEFKIARRGRHVRVVLDNAQEADATSPAGSDVVNLFQQATILTFGAQVADPSLRSSPQNSTKVSSVEWFRRLTTSDNRRQSAADLYTKVENGMIGCLGKISFDGFELSKTAQGMRLYNAKIGCDTSSMGPCLNSPCSNSGQCLPSQTGFTCLCPDRYTGATCEIDLNACESRPCPNGIVCHNLYNDFHCICPAGFTGKTCQLRGDWDPCVTSPCGPYGTCVRSGASFTCNCSNGFNGVYCADRVPNMVPDTADILHSPFMLAVFALIVIALLLAVILVVVCRKTNQNALMKQHKPINEYDDAAAMKPLVPKKGAPPPVPPHGTLTVKTAAAPPLPPRGRGQPHLYSNNHTYANSCNLPTVEVRPMMNYGGHTRLNLSRDSCGSPASSRGGCGKRSTSSNLDCSRNYGSAADDLEVLAKEPRRGSGQVTTDGPPLPARSSDSANSSRRGSSSTGCAGDISSNEQFVSQSRYRGNNNRSLADSIQCLPTTEEIEIDLDDDDDVHANERSHMLEDLRRDQQRLDMATQAWQGRAAVENPEPTDYVTMKPVSKIKPFSGSASQSGHNIPDIDADPNNAPPPPPAHRPPPQPTSEASSMLTSPQRTHTDTTKLYDNPVDDTLSSVTSNGLDD